MHTHMKHTDACTHTCMRENFSSRCIRLAHACIHTCMHMDTHMHAKTLAHIAVSCVYHVCSRCVRAYTRALRGQISRARASEAALGQELILPHPLNPVSRPLTPTHAHSRPLTPTQVRMHMRMHKSLTNTVFFFLACAHAYTKESE